jgi:two-component system nitrogen regulation sensor histidine kinase NtrY
VPAYFNTRGWMTALLGADLVIAMGLVAMLAGRITQIWLDRRRGAAGSRLHMRLVLLCSVFTVMPTVDRGDHHGAAVRQLHRLRGEARPDLLRGGPRDRRAGATRARERDLRDISAIATPLQDQGIDFLEG